MAHSPDRSPIPMHKRRRMASSSPTYDMEFPAFSQDDLAACDLIEANLSSQDWNSRNVGAMRNNNLESDDPDNPFTVKPPATMAPALVGFTSGTALLAQPRSPTPEEHNSDQPEEKDYSSWFESQPLHVDAPIGFQKASSATIVPLSKTPNFASASSFANMTVDTTEFASASAIGFTKASNNGGLLVPSAEAFAKAQQRLKEWQDSDEPHSTDSLPPQPPAVRPIPHPVQNTAPCPATPATPTPIGPIRPKARSKAFKPPFISNTPAKVPTVVQSSSTPLEHSLSRSAVPSSISTPIRSAVTGLRPARFVTPFKAGMKPSDAGRSKLDHSIPQKISSPIKPVKTLGLPSVPSTSPSKSTRRKYFNTSIPPNRMNLISSGLKPQENSREILMARKIDVSTLSQITPRTARFYSFHSLDGHTLGPTEALSYLLEQGCSSATQSWVTNHWSLILWKLAGMVALDPNQEQHDLNRRWCWEEVLKQLLYRYEREINQGSRPPLRLIVAQDKSSFSPMVLCVSDVTYSEGGIRDDGTPIEPHPELEVTDGWYFLRAQIDAPMARAVRRGIIRPGRKLSVINAKVISERKEPLEILEAYDSISFYLHGNSSHLAAWHEKLGFRPQPSVATLHSVTEDGGSISLMDFTVTKVHPIAYIQFTQDEDGNQVVSSPRKQAEENKLHDSWLRQRERTEESVRTEVYKTLERFENYAQKLDSRKLPSFKPEDFDDMSCITTLEELYDDLLESDEPFQVISRCDRKFAGPLAHYVRLENEKKREKSADSISDEINAAWPPRAVKSFRVVNVQDTCTSRRPKNRTAQLTIWDVLNVQLTENAGRGEFKIGDRFLVTNVSPTQRGAWMDYEEGSEVYLATGHSSRIVGMGRSS